jgi:hypothetical protein
MKLIALLGAAALAAAPAPAIAQSPSYPQAIAVATCVYKRAGMTQRSAFRRALDELMPKYRDQIIRDGSTRASQLIVAEQYEICGLE